MHKYSDQFSPHNALATLLLKHLPKKLNGSHDVSHLIRVWKNARVIQAKEGGDDTILLASVLLHDCVIVEKNSSARFNASRRAAKKASAILRDLDWDKGRISSVRHCIIAHSFSAKVRPISLEAKILQDADRPCAHGLVDNGLRGDE